ncbi:MAG TPA: putative sulfate exporter family transporter, partial [Cyclobacteriaceae bacterium]|nr:putative sulfate exporter family transporter [Cyclobacteriaceae bacterium]
MKKYNNLTQRLITAFLGAAIIIFGIVFSEWTYYAVFFVLCLCSLIEFYDLSGLDGMLPQKTFGTICGMLIFSLSFFIEKEDISYRYYFLIFPIVSFVYLIKLYKKFERKPFTNIAYMILGLFYVAMPFALLNIAVYENGTYNFEIIFGCLFILWASDTGAYFAGTLFGKRKLFERISPKKSWEGALGGALLAVVFTLNAIALFLFPLIGHQLEISQHAFGVWCAIAIHDTSSVVGAASAYGEEALKTATTLKLARALWIIPVAFISALLFKG